MNQLTLLFAVLLATIVSVPAGRRVALPSPVLMTIFGVVLALVPGIPAPNLAPGLILPLVLPPLLFAAARRSHWRQFHRTWRAIVLLAVALVLVSTAVVAVVYSRLDPGLPTAAAVLLGALISPPDPVAASAVAADLSLPRRLINTLESEGLFNDVTAIVVYGVALDAVLTGHFSAPGALGRFALSAVIAVVVGLGTGWASDRAITVLDDATLQVSLSLLVPFAAYVLAEHLHGSGVLAVLLCGLYLSDRADADDVAYRLVGGAFWDIVELLVTGFAFGLIGQELGAVITAVGPGWVRLIGEAMVIVGAVLLVRLLWLLPAAWLSRRLTPGGDADDAPFTWRETVVMWWAGMRGVATVALALAIPLTVHGGAPFPGRNQILFTAFTVVLFTLLVQGLTLPLLVRFIGISADDQAQREAERHLWFRVEQAQLRYLDEITESEEVPDELYERLAARQQARLAQLGSAPADASHADSRRRLAQGRRLRDLDQRMLAAGRREMAAARAEPDANPELVDRVMRQLDLRTFRR